MSEVVRSCSTCLHKTDGGSLVDVPPKCWDCTSFKTLVHWEPKEPKKLTLEEYYKTLGEDPVTVLPDALATQVGGDHYKKLKIQPMEYSMANGLDACQHTAIKYVTRFRDKGTPIEDLDKAIHAIQLLKDFYLKETPSDV